MAIEQNTTTAVRSILGNSHLCKLRVSTPVVRVYLGVCPHMEPAGRRLPWVILPGTTGRFCIIIMCTETTEPSWRGWGQQVALYELVRTSINKMYMAVRTSYHMLKFHMPTQLPDCAGTK